MALGGSDMMELIKQTHEAYLGKAKELKEALKKRDIERDGLVPILSWTWS
jgi:hypothetical protein